MEILRLSEEAEKMDKGVAVFKGKFIGPPIVLQAKKVLEQNRRIKQKRGQGEETGS